MQQSDWRFCGKCFSMFFDGDPNRKGACPNDGRNHSAVGYMFTLPHDIPEAGNGQSQWRFCQKCFAMFFDADPNHKGICDAGGGHQSQGFMFVLPHDVPGSSTAQTAWRFCQKCFVMFFDGFDGKGSCAGRGGHQSQGFMFVLPHIEDDVFTFDSGPITSNLPLGGSAHLVVNRTGTFTFSTHAHDSGFDNIDYSLAAALVSPQGVAYTFGHQGGVEGTSAGLPFGTPRRDDNFTAPGTNADITTNFEKLRGAVLIGRLSGTDALVNGITQLIEQALTDAAKQLGTAAATAVLKLV
jgi:hypothetical protein